jgi:selenide,water dikinase
VVDTAGLVAYPGVLDAAAGGTRTGGDRRNRDYLDGHLDSSAGEAAEAVCMDPQTSGGLLAAVDPELADELVAGDQGWWQVGVVEAGDPAVVLR